MHADQSPPLPPALAVLRKRCGGARLCEHSCPFSGWAYPLSCAAMPTLSAIHSYGQGHVLGSVHTLAAVCIGRADTCARLSLSDAVSARRIPSNRKLWKGTEGKGREGKGSTAAPGESRTSQRRHWVWDAFWCGHGGSAAASLPRCCAGAAAR
jgi:hypothetical protein